MKNRRHTPEQIVRKLAEGDKLLGQGKSVEEVARALEVTEATWYRWKNQYGGMKADDAKRLKELEKENRILKRKLKRAEWLLEISKKGAELMEKMALGHQFETEDSE